MIRDGGCNIKENTKVMLKVLAIFIFMAVVLLITPSATSSAAYVTVTYTQTNPATKISDIASTDDTLYLYFDTTNVIEAYDLGGNYKYSILIHSHQKGSGRIATKENLLYIQDKEGNIHILDNEDVVSFHEYAATDYKMIFSENKEAFYTSHRTVYDAVTGEAVMTRPINAPGILESIWIAALVAGILGILIYFVKKKQ